jgi:hypothetical protein
MHGHDSAIGLYPDLAHCRDLLAARVDHNHV